MGPTDKSDRALDALLARASGPPAMDEGLASRIAAAARHMPQQQPPAPAPWAAGMALAASLALGIWLGSHDIGTSLLGLSAATDSDVSFTGLEDAADLADGDAP